MKKIIYLTTLALGLLIISSCEPTRDYNGDLLIGVDYKPNTGLTDESNKVLKQINTQITNEETGNNIIENYTFNYTSKQLTSFRLNNDIFNIEYNDTKISKIIGDRQSSDFYFSGDFLSKVTTTLNNDDIVTYAYNYTGGKLSKIVTIHDSSITNNRKTYTETNFTFDDKNISRSITKIGIYNPETGALEMSSDEKTFTYLYDDKKSPYQLLPKEFCTYWIGNYECRGDILSSNNPISYILKNGSNPEKVITYSNSYDEDYLNSALGENSIFEFIYE